MTSSIGRNTLFLTVASIAQKVLAFAYFLFVARVLTPEETGQYFLALSITAIFSVVADVGLTQVVIREIAKRPAEGVTLLRRALGVKLPFLGVAALGSIALAFALGYAPLVRELVALACVVLIADALSLLWFGALRGWQTLSYESIGMFAGQMCTLLVGGGILLFAPDVKALVAALIVGSVFNLVYAGYHVWKRAGRTAFMPLFDGRSLRALLVAALPFALAGAFVKVYSYVDSIFLSKWIGAEAVGIYAVAYKFTYAFQFLPLAFAAALYPGMSAVSEADRARLGELLNDGLWYMALLAAPIAFGLFAIAPDAVALVGGAYREAAAALAILTFATVPLFLDVPIGALLNATGRAHVQTTIMGLTMIVNIVANVLLIPPFGILGASAAGVISFSFLFLAGLVYVPRVIPDYSYKRLFRLAAPPLLAGAVMALVVRFAREPLALPFGPSEIAFLPVLPIAAGVYVLLLFAFGSLRPRHLAHAMRLLKRDV